MATKSLVQILFKSGAKIEDWFTQIQVKSTDGVVTELSYAMEDGSTPLMFTDLSSIDSIYVKQTVEYFDGTL